MQCFVLAFVVFYLAQFCPRRSAFLFRVFWAGSKPSHTNDYAAFVQDTMRVTGHFGLTLGVCYDLQTFATKYLKSNRL
jgi:outer membrane receptor protein involved in Fe transport